MSSFRLKAYTSIWVALFSYIGVLVRLSLTRLAHSVSNSFLLQLGSDFFLSNMVGSFLLGIVAGVGTPIPAWSTPIRVGFHVGFCGSCTTFATWQLESGINGLHGKWIDSILQSLFTYSTSYMSLALGREIGKGIKPKINKIWMAWLKRKDKLKSNSSSLRVEMPTVLPVLEEEPKSFRSIAELDSSHSSVRSSIIASPTYKPSASAMCIQFMFFISLSLALWPAILWDKGWRRHWWISIAFGPIGALTRHLVTVYNDKLPNFPLMTFLCNIVASALSIVIIVLDNHVTPSMSMESVNQFRLIVKSGLLTGCLGSLSTVSTFVNEVWKYVNNDHKVFVATRYVLASIVAGQFVVLMIGSIYISMGNKLIMN